MTAPRWATVPAALLGLLLLAAHPRPAACGVEEFSTFSAEAPEEDDESLLDHVLTRTPRSWRDEWERAPMAIRTAQGCLTSGQWFIDTDLKLRAPMGKRAHFDLLMRQSESDVVNYSYLDFSFAFPTRWGTPGAMFRPLHDKSRQDFALTWEAGNDTAGTSILAVFTFEDVFNNLWAFRQDRVGNASEPYLRRPYEPAFRVIHRADWWRAELSGKYLTPSVKSVQAWTEGAPPREASLWGTDGRAAVEAQAFGMEWEVSALNHQAKSTDRQLDGANGDAHEFRRLWTVESALRRQVHPRVLLEARAGYTDRAHNYRPPTADGWFAAIDRLAALEANIELVPAVHARIGGLYDRITVAKAGQTLWNTYGTRNESRAFVGLVARFGRVSISGVEGIELDPEPYEVWFVHDKGFLHLQATF